MGFISIKDKDKDWDLGSFDVQQNEDKEDRNVLHTIDRRAANGGGHILRRNCLLQSINEGKK